MSGLVGFVGRYDEYRRRDHARIDAYWDKRTADDWCFQFHRGKPSACDACVRAVVEVREGRRLPL